MNLDFDTVKKGTKISSIKVDPRLRQRDSCGLDFVDQVLSGDAKVRGFVPSTVWLFTGTPGAGKTTLSLQLASSLAELGHEVLFNSGEESLAQVKMTVERLELPGDFTVGADVFVDRPPGKADAKKVKQTFREHVTHLRGKLEKRNAKIKKEANKKRLFLIVDSLQSMNDGKYGFASNGKTPVKVLEELTQLAKKHYLTVIVIGQVGKSGDFKGSNTLLHMVDGQLHLFIDDDEKSSTYEKRLLETRKNRWGPSGIAVALDIDRNGLAEVGDRRFRARRV